MDMTALYKLSCGLYVITTVDGGRGVGCVVNTVTQVTAEPVQVIGNRFVIYREAREDSRIHLDELG